MPVLMCDPMGHRLDVANDQSHQKRQQGCPKVGFLHDRPTGEVKNGEGTSEQNDETEEELPHIAAHHLHAEGEHRTETKQNGNVAAGVFGEITSELRQSRPRSRLHYPRLQGRSRPEKGHRNHNDQ